MKRNLVLLFVGRAFGIGSSTAVEAAIQKYINKVRVEYANLQPLGRVNSDLKWEALITNIDILDTCEIQKIDYVNGGDAHLYDVYDYDRVGLLQWVCEGNECDDMSDEQPAVDWAAQGECYTYAPFGEGGDKLAGCEQKTISDFTQVFWQTTVEKDGKHLAGPPVEFGCAISNCNSNKGKVVSCLFGPGSNVPGIHPFPTCALDKLAEVFPNMPPKGTTTTTTSSTPFSSTTVKSSSSSSTTTVEISSTSTTEKVTTATSTTQWGEDTWHQMLIDEHNLRRAEWAGLPPVVANMEIAAHAAKWAEFLAVTCEIYHSTNDQRTDVGGYQRVGENIWRCVGNSCPGLSATLPVKTWTNEVECYQYAPYGHSSQWRPDVSWCNEEYDVGHFTQVFWDTESYWEREKFGPLKEVGCGRARCKAGDGYSPNVLVVCQYGPAGNLGDYYPFDQNAALTITETYPHVFSTTTPKPTSSTTSTAWQRPPGEPSDPPEIGWYRQLGCGTSEHPDDNGPPGWFYTRSACYLTPQNAHTDCCKYQGANYFAIGGAWTTKTHDHHNAFACYHNFPGGEMRPISECDQPCQGFDGYGPDNGICGGGCYGCPQFPSYEAECIGNSNILCGTRWSIYSCDVTSDEPAHEP